MKKTVAIIGGGVVGCATAYELSQKGLEVYVLEQGERLAEGVTSRNSGVVHAGIYYPPKSLKAESCIRGIELLYEWCATKNVPHKQTGKWIVGGKDQEEDLQRLFENARASGAKELEFQKSISLDGVKGSIGIFSKKTGIIDPTAFTHSFIANSPGVEVLTNAKVLSIEKKGANYLLKTARGEIETEVVVNAAGLQCDEVAKLIGIEKYKIYPWIGHYFHLRSNRTYKHLIYPVKRKNDPGLGVHLTLGLDGSMRLGPDVAPAKDKNDFKPPLELEARRAQFVQAASVYLEGIQASSLSYDTCGIRPKLRNFDDKEEKDFVISEDLPGFINLIGIESPGLTAARDLAQRICEKYVH